MQAHLREISRNVAPGAHAVLLLDRAGWHTTGELKVPKNITLLFLPFRAPELNPHENLWQFLRQTYLSNRVFETYEDLRGPPRCRLRSLEPPRRPALAHHVHRIARLGSQRSFVLTAGISHCICEVFEVAYYFWGCQDSLHFGMVARGRFRNWLK